MSQMPISVSFPGRDTIANNLEFIEVSICGRGKLCLISLFIYNAWHVVGT